MTQQPCIESYFFKGFWVHSGGVKSILLHRLADVQKNYVNNKNKYNLVSMMF